MELFSHMRLPPSSQTTLVCFKLEKKMSSTSPPFTESRSTWMIHYMDTQLIAKANLTSTIITIYGRNWSYLSGCKPIFLLEAYPAQFMFSEVNIILETKIYPCFLTVCVF